MLKSEHHEADLRSGPRRAGVILHPTSLPGPADVGDLGPDAYRFVDFLEASGFSIWQTLPLAPTHSDLSPYQARSVHAGNPHLISLHELVRKGWLEEEQLVGPAHVGSTTWASRLAQARRGFERNASDGERADYESFVAESAFWLEDYALFEVLRANHDQTPWWQWPQNERDRESAALDLARHRHEEALRQQRFEQYVFARQWQALRRHANDKGVLIFGDIPIFVAHDSAEVWAHRRCFRLDGEGRTEVVAGVPPDYFSETGQRWGNPHYDWNYLRDHGFDWWLDRLGTELKRADLVRIDHFRGLESCWEIPADSETAVQGQWREVPGQELLQAILDRYGELPLVVEDLGIITEKVEALRDSFQLPGMKVLQFAFDGSATNPYLPHQAVRNCVVYTGTHDNDTLLGWWHGLNSDQRRYMLDYLGVQLDAMPRGLIRAAYESVARLAILPMQDVLRLGSEARMNTPGTQTQNWRWRFQWDQISDETVAHYRHLAELYGRAIQ